MLKIASTFASTLLQTTCNLLIYKGFYLYEEEEGWKEELFSLWLLGDMKLFDEDENDYEVVRPPLYCRAVNFFSSLITPIK